MFPGQQAQASASDQKSMDMDELKKVFKMFDSDGSGEIDVHDLHDAVRYLGIKCTANCMNKVLSFIDTDGNGTVDWGEFYDFFSKVRNPEEIKQMLASTNQRFLDYKDMVESDPNFQRRFYIPEVYNAVCKPYEGHNDNVEDVAWISDTQFISVSIDHDIKIWDITNSATKAIRSIEAGVGLYAVGVIEDKKNNKSKFITGSASKTDNLKLWDLTTDAVIQDYVGHESAVYSVCLSPDNRFVLSGDKLGLVCFHDVEKSNPMCLVTGHDNVVYSCDFEEDGSTTCTASGDGTVQVNDIRALNSAKPVVTIEDAAATGIVYKALWRNDREIVTCGDDYCIKRWDIRHLKNGPVTNYFGHTSIVRSIALTADKECCVSATNDGSLRLWVLDERFNIEQMQETVSTKMDIAKDKIKQAENDMEECTSDITPDQLKAMRKELEDLTEQSKDLLFVRTERDDMQCVQAHYSLSGHSAPCVAVTIRQDSTNKNKLNIISAAQDQTLRRFQVEKPDTSKFQRWTQEKV